MNLYEIAERILLGGVFTGPELEAVKDSCVHPRYGEDVVMAGLNRAKWQVVKSESSVEVISEWLKYRGVHSSFSHAGEFLVKLFREHPWMSDMFFSTAVEIGFKLPAVCIRWYRDRIIAGGYLLKIKPNGAPEDVVELFCCLGDDPSDEMVVYVCSFIPVERWEGITYSHQTLTAIFDGLSSKGSLKVLNKLREHKAVLRAAIRSKTPAHEAKAMAFCELLPKMSSHPSYLMDLDLNVSFVIPENIFGGDILKVMVALSLLGTGKQHISGLPSKDELQARMIELWLGDHPQADAIYAEAINVRNELARAIGRAKQARANNDRNTERKAA